MTHPQDPGSSTWFDRAGMVLAAPSASADALGGWEQMDALRDRLVAVDDLAELSADDQQLVLRCEAEVRAGLSPVLQNAGDDSDWRAEDAADTTDQTADDDGWVGV